MKLLIIGGKKFLGYHVALEASKRGHSVTLFNRGITYPDLLPEMPSIKGDRNTDMARLAGMTFDAVIDTCAYFPNQVKKTVQVLGTNIKKYMLVSSLSACDGSVINVPETEPVCGLDFISTEITDASYGPLKAACEKQLTDVLGNNKSIIIRPGYIVGDRDHTDRFTYWPIMMKHMEKMLIPETGDLNIQFIDVRDIAIFMIKALEKNLNGIYHVTGPKKPLKFNEFINTCQKTVNSDCKLIKINDKWLLEHNLIKYLAFPLCIDIEAYKGIHCANIEKALQAGLTTRPPEDTILSALKWYQQYKGDANLLAAGLKPSPMKCLISDYVTE